MVKEKRNATILRSHFEITSKYPKRRPREKEKTDAVPATATTIAPPVSTHSKPIKKCVVKIKRHKLPSKPTINHLVDTLNSGETMFHPDLVQNSTMVCQPTPCRVRLKRISVTKTKNPAAINQPTGGEHRFFHRDQPPTRTRSSVTRNVYEFLSQSQIEDEERNDPAEDIIKKMVNEGRACIMTRTRKPGQFRAKPVKRKVRVVGKRKQCSLDDVPPAASSKENRQQAMSPIFDLNGDCGDQQTPRPIGPISRKLPQAMSPIYELDADSNDESVPEPIQVEAQVHVSSPEIHNSVNESSAYSHLARSVMMNQTQNHNKLQSTTKRREQLDMVRQFISTPISDKIGKDVTTTISPIPMQATKVVGPDGSSSPWRVSHESPLPDTFRFGLNTSYLPSFSSDHQQKRHVYIPDENSEPTASDSICPTLVENENNSNGENMPPANTTGNENMENIVHLPNPRRTLQHRTPLKDINILEVVHLPSWKKNPLAHATPAKDANDEASLFSQSPNSNRNRHENRNLFGFEEFLDPNEHSQHEAQAAALSQNQNLNDKLQRMKRLRPIESEMPRVASTPLRYAYDDQLQQRSIRQMLCSTMIAPVFRPPPRRADDSVGLFRDTQPDPEASFDHKKPRRTYVQERPKRKRKQRVKILFVDTDSSDDDEEQDSLDNSTSPHKTGKKRPRKDAEHEAKLKEFITSFNKQCEEVAQFPVVIE